MSGTKLKGSPVSLSGNLPELGNKAPEFLLTKSDLSDVSLSSFSGSKLVLNIFPSLDTAVCATSVRKFNELASGLENTKVLCISSDLPFAHNRFCSAEGIKNVITLSEMHKKDFGENYGIRITNGPLAGVLARVVIVLDENGIVKYSELVSEITNEPNYDAAISNLKSI
jgi:thioredoxin-dependent peroxiredoxin